MPGRLEPEPLRRRDFLGLAAIWSSILACLAAALGALRLPMPAVFPESNSRVKIGPPDRFSNDAPTQLSELRVWVYRDTGGLYALSSVCTHLGCIAAKEKTGGFKCPCHGSRFDASGKVVGGPAPKRLEFLELAMAPDGQVVIDTSRAVDPDERLAV